MWILIGALLTMLAIVLLNKPAPPPIAPPTGSALGSAGSSGSVGAPSPSPALASGSPVPVTKPTSGPNKIIDIQNSQEAVDFLAQGGLLMIYAPWCGHCKNMMPALEEASNAPNTRVARFEGGKEPKFMAEQNIRGFPTLLLKGSGSGEYPKYTGGRDAQSLIQAASI
jgi:thiol-disulfide isomerase/thioredoxin